jgi:arginine-tRNA-protein transferase
MTTATVHELDHCNYWPHADKHSRFEFDLAAAPLNRNLEKWRAAKFAELARGGLSGSDGVYHPSCPSCPASEFCVPARVVLSDFSMSDSQRAKHDLFRALVDVEKKPGNYFDPDIFQLYKNYIPARHGDSQTYMGGYTANRFKEVFGNNAWLYTARMKSGELLAASMVDQHGPDYCAEYQIYDPSWGKISPGISMTLSLVELMRAENPNGHLYVGSWSPGSPKLGYKNQFYGTEIFSGGRWQHMERLSKAAPSSPAL